MMRINFFFLLLAAILLPALLRAQVTKATISGEIKDQADYSALSFVNVVLKTEPGDNFVVGSITDDDGRFVLTDIRPGSYWLEVSVLGYTPVRQSLFVGSLSGFLDIKPIEMTELAAALDEVEITAGPAAISGKLDKKTYSLEDNISQSGGSVLQAIQNLPGISVQEGKVQLRGSDKITVLIDGKQTALTGFGSQSGLDNIPASAIERIEIINNPSAKYDANGNAGIINIIYKKNKQQGWSGKAGLGGGLGALWIKRDNLPTIRPQYQRTPKVNPTLAANYRTMNINLFFQGDYLYTETLNKNEFVTRTYDDGTVIQQQTKRNRNTGFLTTKAGIDWNFDPQNTLTVSGLFGREKILDNGDEPFFNADLSDRLRLWQFLEDELKTTVMATAAFQHKYKQPGHVLNMGFNYTFHREDEKYFFDNILPTYTGEDSFKLLSDEHVGDFNLDYIRPLAYGRVEGGVKIRRRTIPTNMQFFPGLNSPLDTNAGGWATYKEIIPALYSNYVFESKKIEAEIGLRVEYAGLQYEVNPDHSTYKSDGYNYTQPFPSVRLGYKIDDHQKISFFYNRRVDRPNEVDIRIFPKYDDAEIIKVGNPALQPQFTNTLELGYKASRENGYFYSAVYHRMADATITRIASVVPGSNLIYDVFQNADRSYNTGIELVFAQNAGKWLTASLNLNGWYNQINAFSVDNKYPVANTFSAEQQSIYSGSAKMNALFHFPAQLDLQVSAIYLAPDIIPQGRIGTRFSLDTGVKKRIQNGKGEIYFNATDLLNTMLIQKDILGDGFRYTSRDYYETQVVRAGYTYKF